MTKTNNKLGETHLQLKSKQGISFLSKSLY